MIYTIKGTLTGGMYAPSHEVSRTIRIGGSATLDDLCDVMLRSLDFDHDHMYQFCMDNRPYSNNGYISGKGRDGMPSTREKLYRAGLKTGQKFLFIYDFGDDWMFQMEVLSAVNESGNIPAEVLESVGEVEQYPVWDETEDEEDGLPFDEEGASPADTELQSVPGNASPSGLENMVGTLFGGTDEDEPDLSEEYFDSDYEYDEGPEGEETNPRLGRILLRVIETQIEKKDPAFVAEAYAALQRKGYIRKLAKVKLAIALSSEIFEVMKNDKPHSEERYRSFVEAAVREKLDEDSVLDIETGREHTITELLDEFESLLMEEENADAAADVFLQVWPLLKNFIDQNYTRETENGLKRYSPGQIDEGMEFRMNLYNSIMDADMAFLNSKRYAEGVETLQEILDTFEWQDGEDASIRGAIGECLESQGRTEEADRWFRSWLQESPKDPDCANYYVMVLMERGEMEQAELLLRECLPEGLPAEIKYINLYGRAEEYYKTVGERGKAKKFSALIDEIEKKTPSWIQDDDNWDGKLQFGGMFDPEFGLDDFSFPGKSTQGKTVVKAEKKIYPNDPCPCGSGKKYKKCCGKNK